MPIGPAFVLAPGLELRRLPGAGSAPLYRVPAGTEVLVVRGRTLAGVLWLRLRLPDGREGWAAETDPVVPLHAATIVDEGVPLRGEARSAATVLVTLRQGATVTVLAPPGAEPLEFVRVRLPGSGREGYVAGSTRVVWDREVPGPGAGPPLGMTHTVSRLDVQRAATRLIWTGIRGAIGAIARWRGNRARTGSIGQVPPAT